MEKMTHPLNKLEIWFFYCFLASFTLSVRKVLMSFPAKGEFNEYTGIYLYLSDIFLILVLISCFLSILCNKIFNKSIYKVDILSYIKQYFVILPLLFIIFAFLSTFWSDTWIISIYRSVKLVLFYLLYLWVIFRLFPFIICLIKDRSDNYINSKYKCLTIKEMFHSSTVPRGTIYGENVEHSTRQVWNIFNIFYLIIITTGFMQSVIGIWQFIIQKSIGLLWFKESIISPSTLGAAKIVLNGDKYIRAYGLFPHPNILGGFLVLSILFTILYLKMFHPSTNVPRGTLYGVGVEQEHRNECSTWNNYVFYFIIFIQIICFFLTFSKSAWAGLIIALAYLYIKNVPRGTLKSLITNKYKYFALFGGIIISLVLITKPNWYSLLGISINDRIAYLNVSHGTFADHPISGVGMGNYITYIANKYPILELWQYQPVHNVFLLVLNELGIIGFLVLVWFLWKILKNVPCGTLGDNKFHLTMKAIFLGFIFIMLFDHYFWDIQQGQIMLWLVLGLLVGSKMWINKEINTYTQDKEKNIDN